MDKWQELLEWCGIKFIPRDTRFPDQDGLMLFPNGTQTPVTHRSFPILDLNNLFAYPVKKMRGLGYSFSLTMGSENCMAYFLKDEDTFSSLKENELDTLFEACYKVYLHEKGK